MNGNEQWLQSIVTAFNDLRAGFTEYLPTLIAAVVLVVLGCLIAYLIKRLVLRLGSITHQLAERTGLARNYSLIHLPWPLSVIIANLLFWIAIILVMSAAADVLGLPGIADWMAAVMRYLPRVFAAASILLVGYIFAAFLRDSIGRATTRLEDSQLFAHGAFMTVNAVALVVAFDQLGIDVSLIQQLIVITIAAFFFGVALAFGLGARASVDNIIGGYYLKRFYRVGQRVRIGALEGEILELTPTAVILDVAEGRAQIPARQFNEQVSIIMPAEDFGNAK